MILAGGAERAAEKRQKKLLAVARPAAACYTPVAGLADAAGRSPAWV